MCFRRSCPVCIRLLFRFELSVQLFVLGHPLDYVGNRADAVNILVAALREPDHGREVPKILSRGLLLRARAHVLGRALGAGIVHVQILVPLLQDLLNRVGPQRRRNGQDVLVGGVRVVLTREVGGLGRRNRVLHNF